MRAFSVDRILYSVLVISKQTGEWVMLLIPKKFTIKVPPSSDTITTVILERTDLSAKRMKLPAPPISSVYKPIHGLIELEDGDRFADPLEADKLMSQYQSIDLESDKSDLYRDHLFHLKDTLHRLRICITNLKCKLCMLCSTCFCTITSKNDIDMFLIKNSYPTETIENQELFVCCDLEFFYTRMGVIHNDVSKIYSRLRAILEDANTNQLTMFGGKLHQFQTILMKLDSKHQKRNKYLDDILALKQIISQADLELKRLEKDVEYYSRKKTINIQEEAHVSTRLAELRKEDQQLRKYREDAFIHLYELHREYNNFMMQYNSILTENITMLDTITSNFAYLVPSRK
jgi:hypothetical protein